MSGAKNRSVKSLVLIPALVLCVSALWSQSGTGSTFSFPSIVASPGADGGIGLFNPSKTAASVTLSLVAAEGQALGAPVTVTVPALGQVALTATQLFGSVVNPGASLRVSSPTPGISAYFQTFDANTTFLDGAQAVPDSAINLIFPVVSGAGGARTTLTLLNSTPKNTLVDLALFSTAGTVMGQSRVQVLRQGTYQNSVGTIFPSVSDFSSASHVTAISRSASLFLEPQPVSGTSIFSGISPFADSLDVAALNAVPLTGTFNSGAIPAFVVGAHNFAILSVTNVESANIDVTATAVANDGSSLGTTKIQIQANGGSRQSLTSLFPSLTGEREGWLLLQGSGRITAAVLEGRSDAGAFSAVVMQKTPQYAFLFPQAVQGSGFSTELSLANPGPNTANADVYVIAPSGTTLVRNQVVIPPGRRVSQTLDKYFPELELPSQGVVYVRSTEPLFAISAIASDSGNVLSVFNPQGVPGSYAPAPLQVFAVTGKVILNDRPVKDFTVVLSGPVGRVTKTREDGTYVFAGLPAGRYSMMVDQYGFEFEPAQVNFELKTTSKRQDFSGFTADNAVLVRPGSVPVGSPDTTVSIYGRGFNSSSTAFVGPVRLQTILVDSTQLQVLLPAYLFESAAKFDVHVTTDGSETKSYEIVAFLAQPVLGSVTTAREIVEGSPAATVTLAGSGFLNGAKVNINGTSDGISINVLKDNEIVAVVPSRYFQSGGIYPVTVENPYPANVQSNIQLLTVYFPRPAIESISPAIVAERLEDSAGPIQLEVRGYGFGRGAVVLMDETPLPTVACETTRACFAGQLIATVDPSFLRESGFRDVSVRNPDPALDASAIIYLRVESLQPTVTSVYPGSATLLDLPQPNHEYSLPVLVSGTNFDPKVEVAIRRPGTVAEFAGSDKWISSSQLLSNFRISYPSSLGEWEVLVKNPQPGGGVSPQPISFHITEAAFVANPFLITLTPTAVQAGGPSFTLVVNGTNFQPGSQIVFYSAPLVTTFIGPTQLRAEVPASMVATPGKKPVTVWNPDNGGTSNKLFVEVQ